MVKFSFSAYTLQEIQLLMGKSLSLQLHSTPGKNFPISVEPFPVDDSVFTWDDIEWAVKRMKNHCSGRPSWMRAKHLNGWLAAAKRKEREEAASEKEHLEEERTTEGPDRTGGEETAERRGGTTTDAFNWESVVELAHTLFGEGQLVEEAMYQAVVLLPKGKIDYRGIGLVEVMWKVVAAILN